VKGRASNVNTNDVVKIYNDKFSSNREDTKIYLSKTKPLTIVGNKKSFE
jgi:hypothetical protein